MIPKIERRKHLKRGNPYEYFCWGCGDLRLSLCDDPHKTCANCGSFDIVVGRPMQLDKKALKKAFTNEVRI